MWEFVGVEEGAYFWLSSRVHGGYGMMCASGDPTEAFRYTYPNITNSHEFAVLMPYMKLPVYQNKVYLMAYVSI